MTSPTHDTSKKLVGGLYLTLRKPLPLRRERTAFGNMYLMSHKIEQGDTVLVLQNYTDTEGNEFVLVLHNNQSFYIEANSIGFPV